MAEVTARDNLDIVGEQTVDSGEVRRAVLGLAWPSIIENFLQAGLGFVTTLMVARIGSDAVAGVGSASQMQIIFISAFFSLSMGATVLIAHAFGAGRLETEGTRTAKQSIAIGVFLALIFTVIVLISAEWLMQIVGASPGVVKTGSEFLRWTSISYVFMAIMFILSGALRGVGDTRTPMMVTIVMNALNIAIAYPLIFGAGPIPESGIVGAAWAMNIARIFGAAVMVAIMLRGRRGITIAGLQGWRPDTELLKRLADISIPSMVESILRSGGQILFVVIVFMLGTAVVASNQVVQNAMFLSMFPGFGFAMAATALVGQSLGGKNIPRAKAAGMTATRWAILWMTSMGALFVIFSSQILALGSRGSDAIDKAIILDSGTEAFWIILLIQPPMAIGFVMAGILRGAGDTRFPMISTAVTMWIFRLPLAYLFAIVLDLGLAGIYIAMLVDVTILMSMNVWRYKQGSWQHRTLLGRQRTSSDQLTDEEEVGAEVAVAGD